MKASQHTAEQIIKILEQAEKGDQTIGAVCRTHGMSERKTPGSSGSWPSACSKSMR